MDSDEIPINASGIELRELARAHNWDNGLEVPIAISEHASCDLAVALELFWLADAATVLSIDEDPNGDPWFHFCELIADRILTGYYTGASSSFEVPLTKVQVHNYRRSGLAEIFLTRVSKD